MLFNGFVIVRRRITPNTPYCAARILCEQPRWWVTYIIVKVEVKFANFATSKSALAVCAVRTKTIIERCSLGVCQQDDVTKRSIERDARMNGNKRYAE